MAEPVRHPQSRSGDGKVVGLVHRLPDSIFTKPGYSFLSTLGDEELWLTFEAIGINAVHTGPLAGRRGLWLGGDPER